MFLKGLNLFYFVMIGVFFLLLSSITDASLINPTQSGKFIFFSYGIILIALLFVIRAAFNNTPLVLRVNILDILLLPLFVYIIINRYWIQPTHGFSMRFYELTGLSILYIVLRNISSKVFPYLLLAIVISAIVQAIYGNLQLWGYYPSYHSGFKMTGSFFNPGPYAGFLASVFPIVLGIYLFRGSMFKAADPKFVRQNIKPGTLNVERLSFEYLPLIGIIAILLVVPASRSRAAWLAVLASALFLIAIRYDLKSKISSFLNTSFKKSIAIVLVLCIAVVGFAGLYLFKKDSADGRLLIWKATANMIGDNPVFGAGFDRFQAHYMDEQASYFKGSPDSPYVTTAGDVNYAFNEPLQFLAEEGMIGLLIILALLYFFNVQINLKDPLQAICVAGTLSIMTFSLFSYPAAILPMKVNLVLMLSLMVSQLQDKYIYRWKLFDSETVLNRSFKFAMLFPLVLLIHIGFDKVNQLKKGYEDWNNAFTTYQMGAYQASIEEYEKALPFFRTNGQFLQHYGKALSMAEMHETAVGVLEEAKKYLSTTVIHTALGDSYKALGKFEQAEAAYVYAWRMAPNRFYPKYLLAKLYDETGNYEAATKTAHELLTKEIKIPSTAIREIKAEMEELLEKYSKASSS